MASRQGKRKRVDSDDDEKEQDISDEKHIDDNETDIDNEAIELSIDESCDEEEEEIEVAEEEQVKEEEAEEEQEKEEEAEEEQKEGGEEEEEDEIIDLTTPQEQKTEKSLLNNVSSTKIISLGQNKGDFETPTIVVTARPFPKTDTCIDIVSFDVGTVNLAVARLRFDRATHRCCIVQTALVDIYNPWLSMQQDREFRIVKKGTRKKTKPSHVEPFCGATWPAASRDKNSVLTALNTLSDGKEEETNYNAEENLHRALTYHTKLLREKVVARADAKNESLQWAHDFEMLPLAMHWMPWLHDREIDHVLVEQQKYDNTKMRSISYTLLSLYQMRRILSLSSAPSSSSPSFASSSSSSSMASSSASSTAYNVAVREDATLELFPSTLKLSPWIVNVLLQSWTVETDPALRFVAPKMNKKEANNAKATEKAEEMVTIQTLESIESTRKQRAKNMRDNKMTHDDLVDHASHGKKKASASRVLTHFFTPLSLSSASLLPPPPPPPPPSLRPESTPLSAQSWFGATVKSGKKTQPVVTQHPFRHWLGVQRMEKHNVCDAILQAFAFIIKNEQEPQMVRQRKKRAKASNKKTVSKCVAASSASSSTSSFSCSTFPSSSAK